MLSLTTLLKLAPTMLRICLVTEVLCMLLLLATKYVAPDLIDQEASQIYCQTIYYSSVKLPHDKTLTSISWPDVGSGLAVLLAREEKGLIY